MLTQPSTRPDQKTFFSVIAPLAQTATSFKNWLDSLLAQGHLQATEILLLDTDSRYPKQQSTINALLNEKKEALIQSPYEIRLITWGASITLNEAINRTVNIAKGEWIYLLYSDDQVLRHTFLEFAAAIKEHPTVELISGRFQSLDQHQDIASKSPELLSEGLISDELKTLFLYKNSLVTGCTLYRKDTWQKNGGLKPDLGQAAEWELLRRLACREVCWHYVPRYLCACQSGDRPDYQTGYLNGFMPDFLRVLEQEQTGYSRESIKLAKLHNYKRLFQYVDSCFQDEQFAQGYRILMDLTQYSELGDRLWLEALEQNSLKHKKHLLKILQDLQTRTKN
ncbi:MAG: glycosyltransferase family 2 protein [Limnothrix sp.]